MKIIKAVLFVSAFFVHSVSAGVILEYTGNQFTSAPNLQAVNAAPADLYTTSDSVTGWIELSAALAPNLNSLLVNPLSFAFMDGVNTFTEASTLTTKIFEFSTDGSGSVIYWSVRLQNQAPIAGGGGTQSTIVTSRALTLTGLIFASDFGGDGLCGPSSSSVGCAFDGDRSYTQGAFVRAPGSWQYRTAAGVPVPATLALLGVGLLGLCVSRRKRKLQN